MAEARETELTDTYRSGRAYGKPPATSDLELVQVDAGTPGGELLRRYWQPVALAEDATELPKTRTHVWRVSGLVPRREWHSGAAVSPLHASGHRPDLRQGRSERDTLLLPRLEVRRRWPVPRDTHRTQRASAHASSATLVPAGGATWPALDLYGSPGVAAGISNFLH